MRLLIKYYRPIVHSLIWTVLFALNISYFSSIKGYAIAVERGVWVIGLYLLVFYVNWFFLVPKLYVRRTYFLFFLFSILLLLSTSLGRIGIEKHYQLLSTLAVRPLAEGRMLRHLMLSFTLSLFIFLISFILRITDYYHTQSRQKEALLQQKTEAEFKLLTAQLNPHFLFNALNNIYALVLTKSEKAPDSLMSLSHLLRYVIYETNAEKVSLQKEITYLKYYIDLEALRLTNLSNLIIDIVNTETDSSSIMPLVFIPFVENAFKHSDINRGGFIKIQLKVVNNSLFFKCENSMPLIKNSVDKMGGVGLANTLQRLQMAYPKQHDIHVLNNQNLYSVELNIQL